MAKITITITSPQLIAGYSAMETLLAAQVAVAANDFTGPAERLAAKPLFQTGIGTALGLGGLVTAFPDLAPGQTVGAGLAVSGAVVSDSWDFDYLQKRFINLKPDADFLMGAGAQPWGMAAVVAPGSWLPWDWLTGLRLYFSAGAPSLTAGAYHFSAQNVFGGLGWRFLAPEESSPPWIWDGLTVKTGFGYSQQKLATRLLFGQITQTFSLQPVSILPPVSVTIQLDPKVDVGLVSQVTQVPLEVSTGGWFWQTFSAHLAVGAALAWGTTGVSLAADEPVTVLGYLKSLEAKPGRIAVSGTSEGSGPEWFNAYARLDLRFWAGGINIDLPVAYRFTDGLAAGLTLGVAF